jgi:lysozyme family protein
MPEGRCGLTHICRLIEYRRPVEGAMNASLTGLLFFGARRWRVTMAIFEKAIEVVLAREGGYANDLDDAGGETNFGISKRRYPEVEIKALTREQASALYRRDFWNPAYDHVEPQALATKLLELTLHCQHGDTRPYYETDMVGIRLVQQALRALGDPVVTIDGRFGPQTLQSVKLESPQALLAAIRVEQCRHYLKLVDAAPEQGKFLRGWIRRAVG